MQAKAGLHWPALVQLLVSGLGMLLSLTAASGFALAGVAALASNLSPQEVLPFFTLAWTSGLVAFLLLPSLVLALFRLLDREPPCLRLPDSYWLASRLILFLWPALLLLGQAVSGQPVAALILLPPLQVLAVGLPLWWFVERGRRGIRQANPQCNWKILSFGLLISPPVVLLVEFILLGLLAAAFFAWAASQPAMLEELNRLAQRLANAQMDPEITLRILRPYLQKPAVIFAVLAVGGGLIPLVEELLKPLALWLLSPRLTPAEGFVAGLICGAAFALLETMGMLSAPVNDAWAGVVIGRVGTGLLHTVNTGLVGWGLAVAWSQERYMELGIIFLLAAGLHSIWNIFSILLGISPIFNLLGVDSGLMARLGTAAPITLGVLILTLYLLLAGFNQRLRSPADKTVAGPNLNPGV